MEKPSWPGVVGEVFLFGTAFLIMRGAIVQKQITSTRGVGVIWKIGQANGSLITDSNFTCRLVPKPGAIPFSTINFNVRAL